MPRDSKCNRPRNASRPHFFPAATDARFTSVGTAAISRWARPLCLQGFPESSLPDTLRNANPLGIQRTVNGTLTRDPIAG